MDFIKNKPTIPEALILNGYWSSSSWESSVENWRQIVKQALADNRTVILSASVGQTERGKYIIVAYDGWDTAYTIQGGQIKSISLATT